MNVSLWELHLQLGSRWPGESDFISIHIISISSACLWMHLFLTFCYKTQWVQSFAHRKATIFSRDREEEAAPRKSMSEEEGRDLEAQAMPKRRATECLTFLMEQKMLTIITISLYSIRSPRL